MKNLFIFLLCAIHFSADCQEKVGLYSIKPRDITKIGVFNTLSKIIILKTEKDFSLESFEKDYVEQVNQDSDENLREILKVCDIEQQNISLKDSTQLIYNNEISRYLKVISNLKSEKFTRKYYKEMDKIFSTIAVSDTLSNLIQSQNLRFALGCVIEGFTRTKSSNKKRIISNIGSSILGGTLFGFNGMLTGMGLKDSKHTTIAYAFIIDAREKKLCKQLQIISANDPLDKKMVKNVLFSFFNNYWVWYNSEADKYLKL